MTDARARRYHVLFLCTGNSARSVIAESVLGRLGAGRFVAHSAGSQPRGSIHPDALRVLDRNGYETRGLHSKNWNAFAEHGATPIDFVVTLCDAAAAQTCPIWPGRPATAHWDLPDPAAIADPIHRARAFADALARLTARIERLVQLPDEALEPASAPHALAAIHAAARADGVEEKA